MRIIGKTDVGKVRKSNQDDYAHGLLSNGAAWAVVCDGMGGANGGSVASSMAVKIISGHIGAYAGPFTEKDVRALLLSALADANAQVYARAQKEVSLYGMGTTVVACVATADSLFVAHAGDSRAYLVGEKEAVQLTRDHSVVQEMVESGKLTEEEAKNHPNRNLITRALGVESELEVDFTARDFPQGTAVLICSDGLTNLVESDAFVKAMHENVEHAAENLTALANKEGGTDNITVVMIVNSSDQE